MESLIFMAFSSEQKFGGFLWEVMAAMSSLFTWFSLHIYSCGVGYISMDEMPFGQDT